MIHDTYIVQRCDDLASAMKDFATDGDKTIYSTADGKSYSLNKMLEEIKTYSDVGKKFSSLINNSYVQTN